MERQLVARADEVIAVSDNLQERLAGLGCDSHLLTHGVDLEHWARRHRRRRYWSRCAGP